MRWESLVSNDARMREGGGGEILGQVGRIGIRNDFYSVLDIRPVRRFTRKKKSDRGYRF